MAYAKRTCYKCGMIKPTNYMRKELVKTSKASTRDSVTFLTWLGFFWGNKTSHRKINRFFFANNKRKHSRKTEKWACERGMCNHTIEGEYTGHTTRQVNEVSSGWLSGFIKQTIYCFLAMIFSPFVFVLLWIFASL